MRPGFRAQPYGLGEPGGGRAPLGPPLTQGKWHSESVPPGLAASGTRGATAGQNMQEGTHAPWRAPSSAAHVLCDLGPVAYLSGPLFQEALLPKLPDTLRCTPHTPGSSPGLAHTGAVTANCTPARPPAVSIFPPQGPGLQHPGGFGCVN